MLSSFEPSAVPCGNRWQMVEHWSRSRYCSSLPAQFVCTPVQYSSQGSTLRPFSPPAPASPLSPVVSEPPLCVVLAPLPPELGALPASPPLAELAPPVIAVEPPLDGCSC